MEFQCILNFFVRILKCSFAKYLYCFQNFLRKSFVPLLKHSTLIADMYCDLIQLFDVLHFVFECIDDQNVHLISVIWRYMCNHPWIRHVTSLHPKEHLQCVISNLMSLNIEIYKATQTIHLLIDMFIRLIFIDWQFMGKFLNKELLPISRL